MTLAPLSPAVRVGHHMRFGKLVWMLQTSQLRLSRADFLKDKREAMPMGRS